MKLRGIARLPQEESWTEDEQLLSKHRKARRKRNKRARRARRVNRMKR